MMIKCHKFNIIFLRSLQMKLSTLKRRDNWGQSIKSCTEVGKDDIVILICYLL